MSLELCHASLLPSNGDPAGLDGCMRTLLGLDIIAHSHSLNTSNFSVGRTAIFLIAFVDSWATCASLCSAVGNTSVTHGPPLITRYITGMENPCF